MPFTPPPTVTPLSGTPPNRGQTEEAFDTNQQNFVDYQVAFVPEINDATDWVNDATVFVEEQADAAEASATASDDSATASAASAVSAAAAATTAISAPGTIATSSSTLTPGLGSKSFTLNETGKAFGVGQFVTIADTTTPTTKFMHGAITAFNSGTGAMTVNVINYYGATSGTTWAVSISAPPNLIGARLIPEVVSATTKTMATGGDYTFTNTAAATTATFPPTPNAGDEVTIDNRPTNRLDLTLARNGSNIMGLAEDHVLTDLAAFTFRYIDATQGWRYR